MRFITLVGQNFPDEHQRLSHTSSRDDKSELAPPTRNVLVPVN